MTRNALIDRLLTPTALAAALLLFLLPMLTYSCSGPQTSAEATTGSIEGTYSGLDIIFDDHPAFVLKFNGMKLAVDELDARSTASLEESKEPLPMKLRAPVIGSAAAIGLALLMALLTWAPAFRKLLIGVLAILAGGGLAFTVYVAAPEFANQLQAQPDRVSQTVDAMREALGRVEIDARPAIGFWAILGVLALVVLLQLGPTPRRKADAVAAGPPDGPTDPLGRERLGEDGHGDVDPPER